MGDSLGGQALAPMLGSVNWSVLSETEVGAPFMKTETAHALGLGNSPSRSAPYLLMYTKREGERGAAGPFTSTNNSGPKRGPQEPLKEIRT